MSRRHFLSTFVIKLFNTNIIKLIIILPSTITGIRKFISKSMNMILLSNIVKELNEKINDNYFSVSHNFDKRNNDKYNDCSIEKLDDFFLKMIMCIRNDESLFELCLFVCLFIYNILVTLFCGASLIFFFWIWIWNGGFDYMQWPMKEKTKLFRISFKFIYIIIMAYVTMNRNLNSNSENTQSLHCYNSLICLSAFCKWLFAH